MMTRLPFAALIIASLFWGTAVSVTKYALRGFGPITLLAISLIAGTAALWTVVILRGHRPPLPWRRAAATQDHDHPQHRGSRDQRDGQQRDRTETAQSVLGHADRCAPEQRRGDQRGERQPGDHRRPARLVDEDISELPRIFGVDVLGKQR